MEDCVRLTFRFGALSWGPFFFTKKSINGTKGLDPRPNSAKYYDDGLNSVLNHCGCSNIILEEYYSKSKVLSKLYNIKIIESKKTFKK